MINPDLLVEQINGFEAGLKRTAEGKVILEQCAHDAVTQSGGSPNLLERVNFLGSNLVTFITGAPMPASNRRPDFFGALIAHPEGLKIVQQSQKAAGSSNRLFGLEANVDLIERMAAHVVQHGRTIAATAPTLPLTPPHALSYQPASPPAPSSVPTRPPGSARDELAFPEAAAKVAAGGFVGQQVHLLATIKKSDMEPPKGDAQPEQFLKHFEFLTFTGKSEKAGVFYQRHRAKISEALEDRRLA